MKKYLFLAFTCLSLSNLHAQKGDSKLFVKVYGNYALPTSASYRSTSYTSTIVNNNYTFNTVKDGLGMGLRAGVGVGMVLNDFINVGLDAENYFGPAIKSNNLYSYDNLDGHVYITNTGVDYQAKIVMVSPNITFKALSQPNFFIYNRLAIKVGVTTKVTEKTNSEYNDRYAEDPNTNPTPTDHITNFKQDFEYQGGIPFGFSAALGFQIKLTDKLRFFTEVEFTQLTYNPKKKVMTLWVNNDGTTVDLSTIDKIQVETEYKKNYTILDGQTDNNAPQPAPTLRMPFSSIGLGIGLIYRM
jgi:hypothetical protein